MSIASEITRLQNAKLALKTSINAKTDNNHQITNETLEDYSSFVDSISGGSSTTFTITDTSYLFYEEARINIYNELKKSFNNVTNMRYMFYNCNNLSSIDVSDLNTSNVTNMNHMFSNCGRLTGLNLNSFNTLNVTDMAYMFYYFAYNVSVNVLDVSSFKTLNVTNMQNMFSNCRQLSSIIFGNNFDTSNVTTMYQMFHNSPLLTTLPQFDCNSCLNVGQMFYLSSGFTTLGGLNNLGMAYLTTRSTNYSNYTLDLSSCTSLTEQSLINVLNGLYDIATKGCNTQSCVLGSTNLAKLTSSAGQQALSDAQTKGWTIS